MGLGANLSVQSPGTTPFSCETYPLYTPDIGRIKTGIVRGLYWDKVPIYSCIATSYSRFTNATLRTSGRRRSRALRPEPNDGAGTDARRGTPSALRRVPGRLCCAATGNRHDPESA